MAESADKGTKKARDRTGWQAQKSAMTRDTILDAALDCFITIGYASTTTAKIADKAKVSRGAMLHHFPSKTELIQAAVEYLHGKLLYLYAKCIDEAIDDEEAHSLPVDERNRRGLQGYWNYLSSDLFTAYHELCVAGRTDPELQYILEDSIARFDENVAQSSKRLFPEWAKRGELYELAMDISQFLMQGMAVSQIVSQKDARVSRMIDYLSDRLEEIFHAGDQDAAIHRHSSRK
ncbi:TetR/AcrR family transcriptional regulator [Halieaceae bacterium IMCC14734]|uniref:TetR/AcrR family transcriptional regulator n=1 Tax=Candidatus Litorirhabdus singularis TaxID=2518993 RepID=A0ABT3TFE6_9GAMM|nr:TetR/AcrR family transcriptional regulator [Candidatus Litorirhabdus singularis]MCX2980132.1 TetR/AcrR family transcriptional regulator [Candidatus Litorirhabdus singularis]